MTNTCRCLPQLCPSLCDLFHISRCPPGLFSLSQMSGFFSNACIKCSIVYIPQFPYAFLQQWALRLFLYLGYFESCCSQHGSTNICFRYWLCYFWTLYPKVGMLVRWFYFWFLAEIPYCFPQWLNQLTLPPTVLRGPLSPHPHQHLLSVVFLRTVILTGVRWCHLVVLICIFLLFIFYFI